MEPTRHEFLFQDNNAKVAFYVLTFLSLIIMVWQVWAMTRQWSTGKPTNWKPAGWPGIKEFVFSQRKVKGSRPKSGAPMHLLVFYGFFGLFLATTLLGIATYAPIVGIPNFHHGAYYLTYEFVFDTVGLAFLIGISWAFFRRIVMQVKFGTPVPDAEGKLSRSQNPVTTDWRDYAALIILAGIAKTGFWVEAMRISASPGTGDQASWVGYGLSRLLPHVDPGVYVAMWWFHAALVWTLFITLPRWRLKHIIVAFFAAAGKPNRPMGELAPVSMEEFEETGKIGAAVATDYSKWHLTSLDACMSCGRCTEVCPAYGAGKTLNPKQVVQDIHRALQVNGDVPATVTEEALWACTTCNACVEACPVLIRHVDLIVDARRYLVAEGRLSGSGATVLRQINSTSHAWGQPKGSREDWMKGLDIPMCRDGVEFDILFWVGCAGATDPAAMRTTQAVAKLLKKAGVRFACLGQEEECTGDPARRIGDEFTFQDQASKNVSVFTKYKIDHVVTACPHCLNTLHHEYKHFGKHLNVMHHTQLLSDLVKASKLNAATAAGVTYHDPCYLARVNRVSDPPRTLLGEETDYDSHATETARAWTSPLTPLKMLREPEHHAQKTLCCGAGGGRMWMEEDPAQRPANKRVKELMETGATTVAVACPFCRIMLDAGLKQEAGDSIKLLDLAEMLQEANA